MTAAHPEDLRWLDAAVALAQPHLGTTASNPTVGALVVDPASQRLIGRGVTARGGRPHAERPALQEAGAAARGATLYITLEPCAHWGRTPPCTDEIIRAGITRVVIGVTDPDPKTHGHGTARLQQAGIEVVAAHHRGSLHLHEGHIARQILGRPFVSLTLALSSDGKVATTDGGRYQADQQARHWIEMQRALSDAVLVGSRTARVDDPDLGVSLPGLHMRTPLRVILSGSRPVDRRIGLVARVSGFPVCVIAATDQTVDVPPGVEVLHVAGDNGRPHLGEALEALSRKGVGRLLVETGPTLCNGLLDEGLVDRFHLIAGDHALGPSGIPARVHGSLEARLESLGFTLVDQRALGVDKLRTYERS